MQPLAQYQVLPCLWDLHFGDGTHLAGVYLAKLPGEVGYRYAIQVMPGSVKVLDIHDDEIIAALDAIKVRFEC
ncbi:MAG: hypothetical protein A4E23_01692 [Methanomethylovorans sp. PtaU1.Bin073]|nr:MAG: hypothetical protein A4E23_01692 [Methanomethylovorans sp. PtaU1.Bin073]